MSRKKGKKIDPNSKTGKILADLLAGKEISHADGFIHYRVSRLSDHIYDIRQAGHNVEDRWEISKNGANYKVYFIPEAVEVG